MTDRTTTATARIAGAKILKDVPELGALIDAKLAEVQRHVFRADRDRIVQVRATVKVLIDNVLAFYAMSLEPPPPEG